MFVPGIGLRTDSPEGNPLRRLRWPGARVESIVVMARMTTVDVHRLLKPLARLAIRLIRLNEAVRH
jgi:hypothetical protein